jgi:hypothetical protein
MVFRPGPDIAAALAAGRAARRSVQLNSPRLAGMLEERLRQQYFVTGGLLAQVRRMTV